MRTTTPAMTSQGRSQITAMTIPWTARTKPVPEVDQAWATRWGKERPSPL